MIMSGPLRTVLPPVHHGARDYGELARLGLDPDDLIDFSTNSNPYGPPADIVQAVQAAVTTETLARYPDRDCLRLRAAIAAADGLPPETILPGNGTAESMQTVAQAFIEPGQRHLIFAPTFGEYERVIRLAGGQVQIYRPRRPDLRHDLAEMIDTLHRLKPDGVWLCNPNNPTGQHWTSADLLTLRSAAPQALWVIDEAYRSFVAEPTPTPTELPKLILLRSLTKDFGLAGLRLGYIVAEETSIERLRAVQPPWSVNSLAQTAGEVALQAEMLTWRQETLTQVRGHAAELWTDLAALGLNVLLSPTTYTLVEVGPAAAFRRALLDHKLLVRDATSFGLPDHIRVAAHRPEENRRLVEAIRQVRAACSPE